MTTLTVTPSPDASGFFLVKIWVVNHTLSADELRELRAAIDAALGDAKPCDVCELCTGRARCDGWQAQ